jgi:hypothetical protein
MVKREKKAKRAKEKKKGVHGHDRFLLGLLRAPHLKNIKIKLCKFLKRKILILITTGESWSVATFCCLLLAASVASRDPSCPGDDG